jgi:hypothetical protein
VSRGRAIDRARARVANAPHPVPKGRTSCASGAQLHVVVRRGGNPANWTSYSTRISSAVPPASTLNSVFQVPGIEYTTPSIA